MSRKRFRILATVVLIAGAFADPACAATKVAFKPDPKSDFMKVAVRAQTATLVDAAVEPVTFSLWNVAGAVVDLTVDPGSFVVNSKGTAWKYKTDRDGSERVFLAVVKRKQAKSGGDFEYIVKAKIDGNLEAADPDATGDFTEQQLSLMGLHVGLGGTEAFAMTGDWERKNKGWVNKEKYVTSTSASPGTDISATPPGAAYLNPLVDPGQDPSILYWAGQYHLVQSSVAGAFDELLIRSSSTLTGLATATPTVVWQGGDQGSPCCTHWAPEIVTLDGKIYIYYAASDFPDDLVYNNQRTYVLEATDPSGPYTFKGLVANTAGGFLSQWAIDALAFEVPGYGPHLVWSGRYSVFEQAMYIARLSNPWTITGPIMELSRPQEEWERRGIVKTNEGPEFLERNGTIHLVYSASFSQTDDYCLAALRLTDGANPLMSASWTKSDDCLFEKNPDASVYGPGHNVLVKSPDGSQYINVYHGNEVSGSAWNGRSVRMQPFGWTADGDPNFGRPVGVGTALATPSGEPGSDPARVEAEYGVVDGVINSYEPRASSGQVTLLPTPTATLELPALQVSAASASIRYRALIAGNLEVSVDGGPSVNVAYDATPPGEFRVFSVALAGGTAVVLSQPSEALEIDCMQIE